MDLDWQTVYTCFSEDTRGKQSHLQKQEILSFQGFFHNYYFLSSPKDICLLNNLSLSPYSSITAFAVRVILKGGSPRVFYRTINHFGGKKNQKQTNKPEPKCAGSLYNKSFLLYVLSEVWDGSEVTSVLIVSAYRILGHLLWAAVKGDHRTPKNCWGCKLPLLQLLFGLKFWKIKFCLQVASAEGHGKWYFIPSSFLILCQFCWMKVLLSLSNPIFRQEAEELRKCAAML